MITTFPLDGLLNERPKYTKLRGRTLGADARGQSLVRLLQLSSSKAELEQVELCLLQLLNLLEGLFAWAGQALDWRTM